VEAEAYLQRAEKYAQDRTITFDLRSELDHCRIKFWQAKGESKLLKEWLTAHSQIENEEPAFRLEADHINLARTWIALEEYHRALTLLARLEPPAEKNGRIGRLIEILVLKSLALTAGGNTKAAQLALQKAFLHGSDEGYVRMFLAGGQPMQDLLYRISQADNVWSPYARALILTSQGNSSESGVPSIAGHAALLSQRELEILRLMAEGLSNQEIADRLYLTLGTVKSHVHHVLTKLNATSRTSAISIARERGWL
jgi:LuxR family maltose regulon positive regulatory protein